MKDLPTWSDLNKGVRKMTDKEFEYCEEMEKRKHDEKVRELEQAKEILQMFLNANDNLDMINAQRKAEIFLNSSEKTNNSDKE